MSSPPAEMTPCPGCGRPLERWIEGMTQGGYCPACRRWDAVATYWPPIDRDSQVYQVVPSPVARPSVEQVRAVAHLQGVNFLAAKRAIRDFPATVFTGRADAVLPVLAALEEAGITFTVHPPFPWTAPDAFAVVAAAGLRPALAPAALDRSGAR